MQVIFNKFRTFALTSVRCCLSYRNDFFSRSQEGWWKSSRFDSNIRQPSTDVICQMMAECHWQNFSLQANTVCHFLFSWHVCKIICQCLDSMHKKLDRHHPGTKKWELPPQYHSSLEFSFQTLDKESCSFFLITIFSLSRQQNVLCSV